MGSSCGGDSDTRGAVGSEKNDSGLAGCGPEFLLLEIEIMRLEGVVLQPDQGDRDQGR
jgi:hypothetical protein